MKKLLLAVVVAFSLGGCASLGNIGTAISIGTSSIVNPVTPTRLYQLENTATVVFAGLNSWKTSCVQGLIPQVCKQQIASVQVYTRQIPPYLTKLRQFVKNNDQVNAIVVWNNVSDIISLVKSQAAAGGVSVGG